MPDAIPASFDEAKEAARQAMLAARAQANQTDATPVPNEHPTEDDEPSEADVEDASTDDEDPEEDLVDGDDEDDADDDEESEDDDDESDDEPEASDEEADKPVEKKSDKRKPSRRSKRINKLQAEVERLRSEREQDEDRLLKRLEQEQARRAALEAEKRQRDQEDQAIEAEMADYLGTDDDYRKAVRAALNGDVFEAEKAKVWDERREIFGKLNRRAETRVNQKAAEIFWASTGELAGVDKEVLQKQDFGSVLKHLHAAGYAVAATEAKKEIDKRDAKIARLEASLKVKSVKKAATSTRTPLEGGTPVRPKAEKSLYEQALDPNTMTIDRDKFNQLKRRASQSAL